MTAAELLRHFEDPGRRFPIQIRMPLANGNVVEGKVSQAIEMPTPFKTPNDVYVSIEVGIGVTISQIHAGDANVIEILGGYEVSSGPGAVDVCPRCGDEGEWAAMALRCRKGHGPFIGGC